METTMMVMDNQVRQCDGLEMDASAGQDAIDTAIRLDRVNRARQGDRIALSELIEQESPGLRRYLLSAVGNLESAEELLQETMVHVVGSIGRLKDAACFRGWLYRIASNEIRNLYRDRRRSAIRFSMLSDGTVEGRTDPDDPEIGQVLQTQEVRGQVASAVARLKEFHRRVVTLRCFERLSYAQISDRIGCSESSARTGFVRAKRQIRHELQRLGLTGS
jgi:RNA polymerase sigma-70 factor (ECF subfamily)